jgi:hypothetical protein
MKKIKDKVEGSKQTYWMYKDGSSYWGVGLYRHGVELPIETTKEIHNEADESIKIKWYSDQPKPVKTCKDDNAEKPAKSVKVVKAVATPKKA